MDDFNPDEYLAKAAAPDQASEADQTAAPAEQAFDPDQYLKEQAPEADTSTIGAAVEGFAKGVISRPGVALAEKGLTRLGVPNLTPEDQAARSEQHGTAEGLGEVAGFVAPALLTAGASGEATAAANAASAGAEALEGGSALAKAAGYTAPGLITKAGAASAAAAKNAGFGKIGSGAIKLLVEGGIIGGADAVGDIINKDSDPEEPAAAALTHMGSKVLTGTLTGAGTSLVAGGALNVLGKVAGSGLRALSDTRAGNGLAQMIHDFGNRWNLAETQGSTPEAVADEMTAFHENVKNARKTTWGDAGVKNKVVDSLSRDVTPEAIQSHVGDVGEAVTKVPKTLQGYAPLEDAVDKWKSITSPNPDPANPFAPPVKPNAGDVFKATDELKGSLDDILYDHNVEESIKAPLRDIRAKIKDSLEDNGTWGKLGDLQAGLNKATHDFIPSLNNYEAAATSREMAPNGQNIRVTNPDRISNLVKSFEKDKKALQKGYVGDFLNNGKAYINKINELYGALGVEGVGTPISTNETEHLINGTLPWGAKFADIVRNGGVSSFSNKLASTVGGAQAGATAGGLPGAVIGGIMGHALPYLEGAIARPIKKYAIPGVLSVLGSGKPEALIDALNHAESVQAGQSAMKSAINAVFLGTRVAETKSEKHKEDLKNFIEHNILDKQIENGAAPQGQPAAAVAPEGFAHGGEVGATVAPPKHVVPPSPLQDNGDKLGSVYPNQASMMGTAKGRVYNYLKSLKPQNNAPALPFDTKHKDHAAEKKYDHALSIAADPLSVMAQIQKGTLNPEIVMHMKQMWPEIHSQLSKKMMEKVVEGQIKGEKPSYKTRQAISLFMGQTLDSAMTPASIMAAQSSFASAQPPQGGAKNKKGTSTLSKVPGSYMTSDQARQQRQNKT